MGRLPTNNRRQPSSLEISLYYTSSQTATNELTKSKPVIPDTVTHTRKPALPKAERLVLLSFAARQTATRANPIATELNKHMTGDTTEPPPPGV